MCKHRSLPLPLAALAPGAAAGLVAFAAPGHLRIGALAPRTAAGAAALPASRRQRAAVDTADRGGRRLAVAGRTVDHGHERFPLPTPRRLYRLRRGCGRRL